MICGPLTASSPGSPGAAMRVGSSLSSRRMLVPGRTWPIVPGFSSSGRRTDWSRPRPNFRSGHSLRPHARRSRSRTSACSGRGRGAPPEMQTRSEVKSVLATAGQSSSAWYMVGTPGRAVACVRLKRLQRLLGIEPGQHHDHPAIQDRAVQHAPCWRTRGTAAARRSLRPARRETGRSAGSAAHSAVRFWCDSIAPLGRPVVPPVYCSRAMSRSGSMATGAGSPRVAGKSVHAT